MLLQYISIFQLYSVLEIVLVLHLVLPISTLVVRRLKVNRRKGGGTAKHIMIFVWREEEE
jgi:hypothetical protein